MIAEEGEDSPGVKKVVYEYVRRVQGSPACRTSGHGVKVVEQRLREAGKEGTMVEPSAHQRLVNR